MEALSGASLLFVGVSLSLHPRSACREAANERRASGKRAQSELSGARPPQPSSAVARQP